MSYTPTTWTTGDTITATALNKIENGIADSGGGSGGYDAVIRLTHSNDSGADTAVNLTPSIKSGSFAQLFDIVDNTNVPNILVEYYHPYGITATVSGYVSYYNYDAIMINVTGYLPMNAQFSVIGVSLIWDSNDDIGWND